MDQRISVITLGVGDLGRARRFYEDGLGWRADAVLDEIVFFQLPGMVFGLYPRAKLAEDARIDVPHAGHGSITLAYNARDKAEVDAVLAQAGAAGATVLKPAEEAFWGGYSGYFADLDNHLWEVAFNPHWRLDDEGRVHLT